MTRVRKDTETGHSLPDDDGRWCAWISQGARCRMRGVFNQSITGGTKWHCSWHAELAKSPALDDRAYFSRFVTFMRQGRYCVVWAHFDEAVLWDAVHGLGGGEKPEPCLNPSCSVRLELERETGIALPPAPLPTRPLAHLLSRHISAAPETGERSAEERARLEAERERQLRELRRRMGGELG